MKKLLIVVAVIVAVVGLIVWVASWFRAPEAVTTSAAQPWPGGLGPLTDAAKPFPPVKANEAAVKLAALANALPKNDTVDQYVWREMERGELTIGEPPALPDVAAMRELLVRDTIVWKRDEGIGGDDDSSSVRAMQLSIARALVASALAKARTNDAAAWDDLHAAWKLARSLDPYPQMMTRTAALAMARSINAVAWKMPLPAPAWFAELQERDGIQPLLESFQFQSASYWSDGAQMFPTKWLANSVEHDRKIAEEVFSTTKCDVTMRMNKLGTDLSSVWRRAFRYRAEREATANALRIREGKSVETTSRCSDGSWAFDGTTLRFSREIPSGPPDRPMPLVLQVKPQQ